MKPKEEAPASAVTKKVTIDLQPATKVDERPPQISTSDHLERMQLFVQQYKQKRQNHTERNQ